MIELNESFECFVLVIVGIEADILGKTRQKVVAKHGLKMCEVRIIFLVNLAVEIETKGHDVDLVEFVVVFDHICQVRDLGSFRGLQERKVFFENRDEVQYVFMWDVIEFDLLLEMQLL